MFLLLVTLFTINSYVFGEVPGNTVGNNVYQPVVPGIPPNDANGYFNSLREFHNTFLNNKPNIISYALSSNSGLSTVQAKSSLTNGSLQQLHQQFAEFAAKVPQQGAVGGGGGGGGSGSGVSYGYGGGQGAQAFGGSFGTVPDGGAIASASVGPSGVHQTAQVYPQNPNNPNVNTRFGSSGGTYSVFTSSQSSSSNLNGKPSHFHRAQTTVNDNGKVTTYTVQDPPGN